MIAKEVRTIPITIVIPTLNEEKNIEKCLQALSDFDDIILIDSGSEDSTTHIAQNYNAKVEQFVWNGKYPKKRNWYLLNFKPKYKWVLFLDADEILTRDFIVEASHKIQNTKANAFFLYDIYFLGKKMKYGIRQRKLALFRFGYGLYEKIEDCGWSTLDMEVHEHPIINGEISEINSSIQHIDDANVNKIYNRHLEYAKWEAQRVRELKNISTEHLTKRQKVKYKFFLKSYFPYLYFITDYIIFGRMLDGYNGFRYSLLKLWYFRKIRMYYYE